MEPTVELLKAFNHVKEQHPTLSMVIIDKEGKWLYMDENFYPLIFDEKIDVSLLEDASDSIEKLPFIYQP